MVPVFCKKINYIFLKCVTPCCQKNHKKYNFQRYPLKQKENAFLNLKYYSFKHFTSIIYVWKNHWFMLNTVWYTVNNVTTHPSSESIKLLQPKHLVCQGTSRSQMPSDLVHFTIYICMHLYVFEKMYNLKWHLLTMHVLDFKIQALVWHIGNINVKLLPGFWI